MPKSPHRESVHGNCEHCLEEWPCRVWTGDKYVSGIQEWEQDARLEEQRLVDELRSQQAAEVERIFRSHGLDFHIPKYARSVTMTIEMLERIASLIGEGEDV